MNTLFTLHSGKLALTGGIIVAAVVLAALLERTTLRLPVQLKQRRRVVKVGRTSLALLALVVVIAIWAEQLRAAALVLSAFAVAIVISTKEMIACALGFWLRLAGGHFRIGDRVQIGDSLRGEVLDYGLLTTTVLDPASAVITVPNSLYLTNAVRNETRYLNYSLHELTVAVPDGSSWPEAEKKLVRCAAAEWAEHAQAARAELARMQHEDADAPPVVYAEPQVFLRQNDDATIALVLRVVLPVRELRQAQDRILRAYLMPEQPSETTT